MGKTYNEDDISRLAKLIGEEFSDKLNVFVEDLDSRIDRKLAPIKDDITELKQDMKTLKVVLRDTNKDVMRLKDRVTHLEEV
ncbi:MAG TPA: hypothetical protein VLG37_01580 [Candidatus Saccharimonadales bacterium]|nr:hypothetical protein [Candidatus Saccharimonadales bacterium]